MAHATSWQSGSVARMRRSAAEPPRASAKVVRLHCPRGPWTEQETPVTVGAVSVPVNRKIIEPDFVRRAAQLGEAAAEHEVAEAELLGDEEHCFLEGRLRAIGKYLRKAHGPLVAHVVPLP